MPALARSLLAGGPPRIGLADAVRATGVDPADLRFALLTHVHWDHLSGLAELPGLTARVTPAELDFRERPSLAVLPGTLRGVEFAALSLDGPPVLTFPASHDVFGDGTVVVCDLAGHTPGHVGVLLALRSGRRLLLAGDAVWNAAGARAARQRPALTRRLVDADPEAAYRTVLRLSRLPAEIPILPAHDLTAIRAAFGHGPLD
jgi:glyoxylase-like metal-dependent hydrolase (beta-lactamase superfamily II)